MTSMKKQEYIPHPIDLSDVQLPRELEDLTELLARNIHEVWAQSRMSQGWRHGEKRDDDLKTHPSLIPYEDLTEQEKQYDRDTALSALKFIVKEGFNISK